MASAAPAVIPVGGAATQVGAAATGAKVALPLSGVAQAGGAGAVGAAAGAGVSTPDGAAATLPPVGMGPPTPAPTLADKAVSGAGSLVKGAAAAGAGSLAAKALSGSTSPAKLEKYKSLRVFDDADKLMGIVPFRDIKGLKHRLI